MASGNPGAVHLDIGLANASKVFGRSRPSFRRKLLSVFAVLLDVTSLTVEAIDMCFGLQLAKVLRRCTLVDVQIGLNYAHGAL